MKKTWLHLFPEADEFESHAQYFVEHGIHFVAGKYKDYNYISALCTDEEAEDCIKWVDKGECE